jgi:hypothetical protein
MNKRLLLGMLLVTAALAMGQAPTATLRNGASSDFAASAQFSAKDTDFATGEGTDISTTHYLSQHIGVRGEADLQHIDKFKMTEYGVRAGMVYRFRPFETVQPFAELLVGYARTRSSWLQNSYKYDSGLSILGGGGADIRMFHEWFLRTGADVAQDSGSHWILNSTAHTNGHNRFARVLVGLSFHPGDYSSKKAW